MLKKRFDEHTREALDWIVDFFDLDDCAAFVAWHLPDRYEEFQSQRVDGQYPWVCSEIAERVLCHD